MFYICLAQYLLVSWKRRTWYTQLREASVHISRFLFVYAFVWLFRFPRSFWTVCCCPSCWSSMIDGSRCQASVWHFERSLFAVWRGNANIRQKGYLPDLAMCVVAPGRTYYHTQTTEQTWSSRGIFDGSIFTIVLFWGVFSSTDCLPSSVETQTFWPAWSYFATCCLRLEISSVVIRKQGTQRRWSSHFYELLRNWRLAWVFLLCLFVVARLKFLENGKSIWNAHVLGGNHNL